MGAEPVAYGAGLLDRVRALAPEGVDVALDMVGTDEALDVSIALVADRARIATIAGFARGPELGIKVLGAAPGADPGTEVRSAARLRLAELAGAGDLVVTVAATYPLDEAKVALNALIGGHTHGKIALIP
jgi:NADPH:quinone reductase-like Zn-dependent oxidoreductase